jgi:MOSC domain-containing protein YiiM
MSAEPEPFYTSNKVLTRLSGHDTVSEVQVNSTFELYLPVKTTRRLLPSAMEGANDDQAAAERPGDGEIAEIVAEVALNVLINYFDILAQEEPLNPAGPTHPRVGLVSVNVAEPDVIGAHHGRPVLSAIGKRPVAAATLRLDALNLEGDRQADLRVHGGPDKAVYAYPAEHLPRWNAELGPEPPFGPGTFGENLTTMGWLEDEVRIGDVWAWGEALLQVSQPRSPCYKLAMVTDRPDILKRLVESGRTGWYLRVLQPGRVPVSGPIHIVERHPAGVTVADVHRAALLGASRAELEAAVRVRPLAEGWRRSFQEDLAELVRAR